MVGFIRAAEFDFAALWAVTVGPGVADDFAVAIINTTRAGVAVLISGARDDGPSILVRPRARPRVLQKLTS